MVSAAFTSSSFSDLHFALGIVFAHFRNYQIILCFLIHCGLFYKNEILQSFFSLCEYSLMPLTTFSLPSCLSSLVLEFNSI